MNMNKIKERYNNSFYRSLGVEQPRAEPRIVVSHPGRDVIGVDIPPQISSSMLGFTNAAEHLCKNAHLTPKQQVLCIQSPQILQVCGYTINFLLLL